MDASNRTPKSRPGPSSRPDIYNVQSERKGLAGFAENLLRQFKNLAHALLLLPLYALGCVAVGVAMMPGIYLLRSVYSLTASYPLFIKVWALGASATAAYLLYGFSLILVMPAVNFILRTHLEPWRGGYYSLPAIRWYIHNGATYIVRYTFLEFITPTPFNIFFYRMMGMKIGEGSIINTSHISDPSLIELGEKVTLGGSVTIVGHYGQGGFLVLAKVKIGDRATIGLRATLMGDIEIGAGAKVLPNSVVLPKTRIPEGETWGGVPAVKIETMREFVKKAA